jgi:hypothetical protein
MDKTFSNKFGTKSFAINFFAFQKLDNERNTVVIEKEKEEYSDKITDIVTDNSYYDWKMVKHTNNLAPLETIIQ